MIREPSSWTIAGSALVAIAAASGAIAALAPILSPDAPPRPPRPEVVDVAPRMSAAPAPAPAPVAAPPVAPPLAKPAPACSLQASVYFAFGLATLDTGSDAALAPIVAFAAAHADATIVIDGHADPTGDELRNLHLSKRRASAVAQKLAALGVKHPITERAFGAFVPANTTDVQAAQRRAEVAISDAKCEGATP